MTINKYVNKAIRTAHGFYNLGRHTYKFGKWAYNKIPKRNPIQISRGKHTQVTAWMQRRNRKGKWINVPKTKEITYKKFKTQNVYKQYLNRFKPYKTV